MKLTAYKQASEFLAAALDTLLRDEAKNNLIVGIADRVRHGRRYGDEAPIFLTVQDGDEVVAAALRTPPYNLIVHCEPGQIDALDQMVEYLSSADPQLPGVNGNTEVSAEFAARWSQRTSLPSTVCMSQRIYTLTEVTPPADVQGGFRWATEEDIPLLAHWFLAFCHEAVPDDPPEHPEENVRRFIETGHLGVWETEGVVSMAGSSRSTPNGATVSAVYTPPEYRGNGYASACVAALSQHMLDQGHQFCTLYTDLSNPTSNKIYQNVGYRPVVDCSMIRFGSSEAA